jgi:hypothetical protein
LFERVEATGTSPSRILGHRWLAGLVGAVVTGLVAGMGLKRAERLGGHGSKTAAPSDLGWEGAVYGLAEGILLSGLPVFLLWQAATDKGWATGWAWTSALAASVVMIAIHHFGYWDFRGPKVGLAIAGCGLLSVAYLVTRSLLAPAVGHVIMHAVGMTAGIELPPLVRAETATSSAYAGRRPRTFRPRAA